jgi:predicted acyl esterase
MFGVNWQTSKRQYRIVEERGVRLRMSDGVEIEVDVLRPDAKDKFPALVAVAPYSKELQSAGVMPGPMVLAKDPKMASACGGRPDFFVRRGYVYVIGSARGTGKSGGKWQFLSRREVEDYCEIVEWAAAQPWCNGNVGSMGFSYFAWSAVTAAAQQPPHLKTVWLSDCGMDHYRDLFYHGGILLPQFLLSWLSTTAAHTVSAVSREELGDDAYRAAIAQALEDKDINAYPGLAEVLKNPDRLPNPIIIDYILHPADDSFHQEKNPQIANINIPVYIGGAWSTYATHLRGVFQGWTELKKGLPKKAVIGPNINEERPLHQYHYEALRWYDYWLKGINSGIMDEPPISLYIQGSNEWKTAEEWPLPETRWTPFNLHPNGLLSELEPRPDSGSDSFEDSPSKRGSLEYYTGRLVENTEVIGHIVMNLYASCTAPEALFFISLWDVDPQDKETLLTRGWLRGSHREVDPKRSKPWLPFHPHTKSQPLTPGEIYEFNIEVVPTGYLFKSGHRICVKISGADDEKGAGFVAGITSPHLWDQTPKTITVYHDADHPSHLLLPITRGNVVETFIGAPRAKKV